MATTPLFFTNNLIFVLQKLKIPIERKADAKAAIVQVEENAAEPIERGPASVVKNTAPKEYFTHKVTSGETVFDLEKRYGLPFDSLASINPGIDKGLSRDPEIKIPVSQVPELKLEPENESEFIRHRVVEGETIYSLADFYQVRVAEMKRVNPVLKYRPVISGEELLVPDKRQRMKQYDERIQDTVWVYPAYRMLGELDEKANQQRHHLKASGKRVS